MAWLVELFDFSGEIQIYLPKLCSNSKKEFRILVGDLLELFRMLPIKYAFMDILLF